MRSERPYKHAQPASEVCDHLHQAAGTLYDPEVVRVFLSLIESGATDTTDNERTMY
jgi:HD-GYP domain-containing protein (c-di-GMP phosphodiesterase class II)